MDAWFVNPTNLVFLLSVPSLLVIFHFAQRRLSRRAQILGINPQNNRREHLALLFITLCLALALARPYLGSQEVEVPKTGRDIVVLFDVSRSMLARDTAPSRLELAKRKVIDLIRILQDRGQSDRLGIVLFSQDTFVLAPLTTDYAALRTYVHALSPRIVTDGGSSLIEGLRGALLMSALSKNTLPQILILSDGEDLNFDRSALKQLISERPFQAHALGVGSDSGGPIDLGSGMFLRDGQGRVVVSKRKREHLSEIASVSGGRYVDIEISASDLRTLLPETDGTISTSDTQKLRIYHEYGSALCVVACALLALLALLDRRALILFAALSFNSIAEAQESSTPYTLRQKLIEGDYQTALQGFKELADKSPQDPALRAALGAAAFGLKDYQSAARYFEEQRKLEQTGRGAFEALYNSGTAHLFAKNRESAIKNLKDALAIKPGDEQAQHNLKLAEQLREEEKPTQKDKKQEEEQKQDSSQQPDKQEQSEDQKEDNGTPPEQQENSPGEKQQQEEHNNSQPAPDDAGEQEEPKADGEKEKAQPQSSNQEEEKNEGQDAQLNEPGDIEPPSSQEAEAWLESLDDSPIIVRPQRQRRRAQGGQSW